MTDNIISYLKHKIINHAASKIICINKDIFNLQNKLKDILEKQHKYKNKKRSQKISPRSKIKAARLGLLAIDEFILESELRAVNYWKSLYTKITRFPRFKIELGQPRSLNEFIKNIDIQRFILNVLFEQENLDYKLLEGEVNSPLNQIKNLLINYPCLTTTDKMLKHNYYYSSKFMFSPGGMRGWSAQYYINHPYKTEFIIRELRGGIFNFLDPKNDKTVKIYNKLLRLLVSQICYIRGNEYKVYILNIGGFTKYSFSLINNLLITPARNEGWIANTNTKISYASTGPKINYNFLYDTLYPNFSKDQGYKDDEFHRFKNISLRYMREPLNYEKLKHNFEIKKKNYKNILYV